MKGKLKVLLLFRVGMVYQIKGNLRANAHEKISSTLTSTGNLYKAVPRFGEFCSCYCLPLLPQLACSILLPGNVLLEIPCTCTVSLHVCTSVIRGKVRLPKFQSTDHCLATKKTGPPPKSWARRLAPYLVCHVIAAYEIFLGGSNNI